MPYKIALSPKVRAIFGDGFSDVEFNGAEGYRLTILMEGEFPEIRNGIPAMRFNPVALHDETSVWEVMAQVADAYRYAENAVSPGTVESRRQKRSTNAQRANSTLFTRNTGGH